MAQYKKSFYASSLYGRIRAFYGDYITEVFDAQQSFTSTIDAKILASLPSNTYTATSPEFMEMTAGTWSTSGTTKRSRTIGAPLEFQGTGDNLQVSFTLQSQGLQIAEAVLFKGELVGSAYQWVQKEVKTLDTFSLSFPGQERTVVFSSFGFADYRVVIKPTKDTGDVIVKTGSLRTSDFSLELSTSANKTTWSAWEKVPLTLVPDQGHIYNVKGTSLTKYSAVRYVKGRISMVTSDDKSTPVIDRIEFRSESSGLYESAGQYTARIDMIEVAKNAGVTFKATKKIRWSETTPTLTTLTVRSASSRENIFWGPTSAPYKKNTKRLRLTRGITNHSVTLGPFQESDSFDFTRVLSYLNWQTQAYYPKDKTDTSISYIFSKTQDNVLDPLNKLQVINDLNKDRTGKITFSPQPFFLTVKMVRGSTRATPVVDNIEFNQELAYREELNIIDQDVSLVDNKMVGRKVLKAIGTHGFKLPNKTGHTAYNMAQIEGAQQKYELKDETRRPADVMVYFASEETKGAKTNKTVDPLETVIAKVTQRKLENGDKTGVNVHYSYGSGQVQYLRPYERELGSDFTPSLNDTLRYKYYIMPGWPDATHKTANKQSFADIAVMYNTSVAALKSLNSSVVLADDQKLVDGQSIRIPNTSKNTDVKLSFKNGTLYTSKSSHNAAYDKRKGKTVTDMSSEKIRVEVPVAPVAGTVPWVSEEKIYTGVINANDVRGEFLTTQYNNASHSDFEREYTVAASDTWQKIATLYDVEVTVLKAINDVETLEVGQIIQIPANIILPDIPQEVELQSQDPYRIRVVADSVHKKNGTRIHESFILVNNMLSGHMPLEYSYGESEPVAVDVVRGISANGMDPLPLNNVARIISIRKKDRTVSYQPWNESVGTGDYSLSQDHVNWWPSGTGKIEPAKGEIYTVTLVRKEVQSVKVHLDTDYFEKIGTDIVWRSPEIKVFDGVCTPDEDFMMEMPAMNTFESYNPQIKNMGYVVEDNDLWVETSIEDRGEQKFLIGSLNGKDPSKNWHPTIKTGYYYLKEQEHYLYSEPLVTVLSEKEVPTAEHVEYVNGPTGIGALILPSGENLIKDSALKATTLKRAVSFTSTSF